MRVRLIVDSTADLIPEVKAGVSVVPLTVHFGDEEYVDGVTITHQQFYEKLVQHPTLPSTSQATPAAFADIFSQVAAEGDSAVVLTVASKLSGTYQSALIAAEEYDRIYIVDSGSAAIGMGILAQLGLELIRQGLSAEEVAQRLTEERENVCVIASLDTLEYLKRGGRISKTVAFAGGLLNIKPVIALEQGEIRVLGKARGARQSGNMLVEEIQKSGGICFDKPFLMGYTGLSEAGLQSFLAEKGEIFAQRPVPTTIVGSVIGTHAGPGAVAAAFFKATK